ncbi:DsbA family protein [Virgibacillus chiguensis]|uniref:Predicted dithiol-disulfide isomerase, DsbA family n=1 Tax=Virgibacillus chiguensis TaxID=411959 RepID=A0A1M5T2E4_9BACI|nr:DsbA family protein [Virgibacillus chiguensis]SHH44929.1 Predicted dithiol-disulfide isomerase, DsbA family [Virgibacillus chiguensis]
MSNKDQMICDLETGVCGEVEDKEMEIMDFGQPDNSIDLYYVTDPICSHCWALEPVLRRFVKQYGSYVNVRVVMGGLLEKWEGFGDHKNGISNPEDVALHWKEVGEHSRMPIDGTLWYDNPVQSSYPPSRVYKVIQKQSEALAEVYLRRVREAVFALNQTVSERSVLVDIVNRMGLDGETIVDEAGSARAQQLLNEDFQLAASLGVRGFPTIIMMNAENKGVKIVGARELNNYIAGLQKVIGVEDLKAESRPSLPTLLQEEKLLFAKEVEEMYDLSPTDFPDFVKKELPTNQYQMKEILGETYLSSIEL